MLVSGQAVVTFDAMNNTHSAFTVLRLPPSLRNRFRVFLSSAAQLPDIQTPSLQHVSTRPNSAFAPCYSQRVGKGAQLGFAHSLAARLPPAVRLLPGEAREKYQRTSHYLAASTDKAGGRQPLRSPQPPQVCNQPPGRPESSFPVNLLRCWAATPDPSLSWSSH